MCLSERWSLMKVLSKSITTANRIISDFEDDNKYVFSSAELLGLLLQLKELRDYRITMTEIFDCGLQLTVGESRYQIFLVSDE
jgi:hypothetical protein